MSSFLAFDPRRYGTTGRSQPPKPSKPSKAEAEAGQSLGDFGALGGSTRATRHLGLGCGRHLGDPGRDENAEVARLLAAAKRALTGVVMGSEEGELVEEEAL
jgi:hypothetical protein